MKKAENETANAILKIADAIDGHSKSIDGLSQNIHWSFRDDFDENVADMLGKINNQFVMFNKLLEEAVDVTGSGYVGDPILDFTEKNPFGDPEEG